MPKRTEIDIDYVARLARLELTAEEKQKFSSQLGHVLEYFERIAAVDVEGVEPTAHAFPIDNVWQEDKPGPTFTVEQALANAKHVKDDMVMVPRVVGEA